MKGEGQAEKRSDQNQKERMKGKGGSGTKMEEKDELCVLHRDGDRRK